MDRKKSHTPSEIKTDYKALPCNLFFC